LDVRLTTSSGQNIVTKSKEALARLSEGQLAEASEEGLGSKGAVVPMMMMKLQKVGFRIFQNCTANLN